MIFKATKIRSIRHAGMLAKHLLRADENEIVEVLEIRGTARPEDLAASLRSMQRATDLTRGKTGLFSVAINPRDHEADNMSPEQWERSLQALEDEFGLAGQPCAIVRHRKNDRSHLHAVYQLTDTEAGKLIDLKQDYRRCQALGRRLEREFGHELTTQEPSRDSYTRQEQQQAKRLGQDVLDRRAALRDDFEQSGNLEEFKELLAAKGYTLAKGDRAGVVLIDSQGEIFGLSRELGLKAADIKKFMGREIDHLPSVEQVKNQPAVQKEKEPGTLEHDLSDNRDKLDDHKNKEMAEKGKFKGASYSFKFEQKLEQPAALPQEPALEKQPDNSSDLSASQDLALAMIERHKEKEELKRLEQEAEKVAERAAELYDRINKKHDQQRTDRKGLDLDR